MLIFLLLFICSTHGGKLINVPIFSDFVLHCDSPKLPENPDRDLFVWLHNGRIIRSINPYLSPNGSISFTNMSPGAGGNYMCCYGKPKMDWCTDEVYLRVSREFFVPFLSWT